MTSYLTTLRGTIQTGTLGEIFSHSLAISSNSTAQVVAEHVRTDWDTAMKHATHGLQNEFPTGVAYTEATAAEIMNLSAGDLKAAFHDPWEPPLAGLSGANMLPSQVALAVSLTAGARANGTPIKGRFYLPPFPISTVDIDGRATNVLQTRVLNMVDDFFGMLTANGDIPSVWSRTTPGLSPILNLRVGKTYDTIRRRRNRYAETYVALPQ